MNLDYLPIATEGHMVSSQETLRVWEDLHDRCRYKHLFEIGTNAGHSAAINLELFPDINVTSLDIGKHKYTHEAADILNKKYQDRFEYINCHSKAYYQRLTSGHYAMPDNVDAVFVDGGHGTECVLNDISIAKYLEVKNVFVDDTDYGPVKSAVGYLQALGVLEKIGHYDYQCMGNNNNPINNQITHFQLL